MAQSKRRRDPQKLMKVLEKQERAARLMANEDFKKWRQELELIARMEGLNSLKPSRSNFDRAMASGILDFVERRFAALDRMARPEAVKQTRDSLEGSHVERERRARGSEHEPAGYAGIAAIGEF